MNCSLLHSIDAKLALRLVFLPFLKNLLVWTTTTLRLEKEIKLISGPAWRTLTTEVFNLEVLNSKILEDDNADFLKFIYDTMRVYWDLTKLTRINSTRIWLPGSLITKMNTVNKYPSISKKHSFIYRKVVIYNKSIFSTANHLIHCVTCIFLVNE